MGDFVSIKGRSLPNYIPKIQVVPRQVSSEEQAQTIAEIGDIFANSAISVSCGYSLLTLMTGFSLNKFWGALNSQQGII